MRRKRGVRQRQKGPVDPRFGQRLRELRTGAGMTQADLAGPDFSKGFVSLVETGRTRASLRAAQIFADRLKVPLAELVDPSPPGPIARLRGVLARAARMESVLEEAERLRRELSDARRALEAEMERG